MIAGEMQGRIGSSIRKQPVHISTLFHGGLEKPYFEHCSDRVMAVTMKNRNLRHEETMYV